ncbi:MAG: hypothetical protein A3J27_10970 [Candidatus Tectomicrobia bacterium RIFCSPLOWO2_12_FULL_69_37]|nr:MAG: hypothetical protein A3J27_10970 [Candidatus Tectomicrobia bacterium RIFCSPLOWO2_12_FULL_69_37]
MTLGKHKSSDNIFKDLGREDAEEAQLRARLLSEILDAIERMGLGQKEMAALLGIKQPEASCLMRGKLSRFSKDRLMSFLVRLGNDIEIVIKRRKKPSRKSAIHPGSIRLIA